MTKISDSSNNKKEKIRKRSSGIKYLKYSEKKLRDALKAVANGMPVRKASKKYKIPFSTIRVKNMGLFPIGKKSGPSVLTAEEENTLVRWIRYADARGIQLTTNLLLDSVKLMVRQLKRKNAFHNDRPGARWYRLFIKRHPELADMISDNKRQKEVAASEQTLREWFETTKGYQIGNSNERIVDVDPKRIFSCNEIAFFLSPNDDQYILNKHVGLYKLEEPHNRECLAAMFAGNAAGQMLPPMVMFAQPEIMKEAIEKIPKTWSTGLSDHGWMTGVSFYEYVTGVFYPWCLENEVRFPVIMYLSKNCSYYTMALDDFCTSHGIELVSLYSNSLRINPMNVALFWPLKKTWQEIMLNWKNICGKDKIMRKTNFAPILKVILESMDIGKHLRNGFSSCGLSPFSADVIHYGKLLDFGQLIHNKTFHQQTSRYNNNVEDQRESTDDGKNKRVDGSKLNKKIKEIQTLNSVKIKIIKNNKRADKKIEKEI